MDDFPRLIEHGFPLRETSLASVHEKNVRHGHISTLHIWPARRPLAACRAALIATLLPDPGDPKKRAEIFKRLAGTIPEDATSAKEIVGGILRWGNETSSDLEWFRKEIRKAYGGRAPRVLDPFAGGGAIPLEAMRLGCEATAIDINPVAWLVLKCTLDYPQRFAGKTRPLPDWSRDYEASEPRLSGVDSKQGDLAAQVRAWGSWVVSRAGAELESYYPTIDGKATFAYLWARTVRCKNCRADIPLLKTRWLCKTDKKFVVLAMKPNPGDSGVDFGVLQLDKKQSLRYDATGTMNASGVRCPCCQAQMTMLELRMEGRSGRMGTAMTAVVVDGVNGKEYRSPTAAERDRAAAAAAALPALFAEIPFGLPTEPMPTAQALGFRVPLYGLDSWDKLFTSRQLLAHGTFVKYARAARAAMSAANYETEWIEAIGANLALCVSKLLGYGNTCCSWHMGHEHISQLFARFALPMKWDFAEVVPTAGSSGSWDSLLDYSIRVLDALEPALLHSSAPVVKRGSAIAIESGKVDLLFTDPPYYEEIPYSDLMDCCLVWLRRMVSDMNSEYEVVFREPLGPKWDHASNDGELIDDSSRFGGNRALSRANYEDGMCRMFSRARDVLTENGRLVVVFANKKPEAWESLVSAIIRAGFVVDASWPILTEMRGGVRNHGRASLASSIWLVCRPRPENAQTGWDSSVREAMRARINDCLREFWDAGIRGPDFVWSAIGPALETYSKYSRVKKVDDPNQLMSVAEFLADVRQRVVGFAAARVLHSSDDVEATLDGPTTYYLLHRHDFGFDPAPVGASILYAISCNLRDTALVDEYDLLVRPSSPKKPSAMTDDDSDESVGVETADSPNKTDKSSVRLKAWDARIRPSLGEDSGVLAAPLIDQIHRLMGLWKSGDLGKVNDYITQRGLTSDNRAREVIQAVIEFALPATEERSILEAISNHLGDTRPQPEAAPALF
jgi:adenine-specific DNA methylase